MPLRPLIALTLAAPCCAGSSFENWRPVRDPSVQHYGLPWSRVGDPHNPNALISQTFPSDPPARVGRVNYKFRIMTREVTCAEWYGFVQAYWPYVAQNAAAGTQFIGLGSGITFHGFANGVPQYSFNEDFADRPIQVGWRYAARFANYLHNDMTNAAWAFERGVYDTSTFGTAQNGQGFNYFTDQQERSEGARFWIPSFDEWTKAGHWDPDRFGEDQGGWWQYPTTSDTAPISGEPGLGGETNGGPFPPGQHRPLDVGSYPHVQSPWGLLDVSGGAHEWMQDAAGFVGNAMPNSRVLAGTSIYFSPPFMPASFDRLGVFALTSPTQLAGVRIASVIPAPGAVWVALFGLAPLASRRRIPAP